jgi:MFS family permease
MPSSPLPPSARLGLLASAALTVMSGTTLAPALPALREAFAGKTNADVRLFVTLPALAIALSAPVVGRLADRFGARRVLVGSLVLYAAAGASGLVVDELAWLLGGRALIGVAAAAAMTASTSIAAAAHEAEARARFFAHQASVMSFASVVSVLLGGLLAARHWRAPFLLFLCAAPVAVLVHWCVAPVRDPERPTSRGTFDPGLVRRLPIYLLTVVGMGFVFVVPLQIPFHLARMGPALGGLAVAMTTLFAAFSALASARFGPRSVTPAGYVGASFFVMGAGFFVVGASTGMAPIFIGLAIVGIGSGWIMPQVSQWLVRSTTERSRSAAIGLLTSSVYAGQFLSPLLTKMLGGRFTHAGGALLVLATAIWALQRRARQA